MCYVSFAMHIGLFLLFVGAGLFLLARELDSGFLLLAWPAVAALVVAFAYFFKRPRWLGKRDDGTLSPLVVLALFPFFAFTWAVWHLQRRLGEDCCNEVAPGLYVGRRPLDEELPGDVSLVVDLTSEFAARRAVREGRPYLCVPTLDADVPAAAVLETTVERILAVTDGKVYVHCASGHGRSATVAAAVLIRRGLAHDAMSAEHLMRRLRPSIRLSGAQRRMVDRVFSQSISARGT